MKKKHYVVLIIVSAFFIPPLIPINKTTEQKTYAIAIKNIKSSLSLPSFGVEIDENNTNDTVILSENKEFHFSFFFNVSISDPFGARMEGVYGEGRQPENWFTKQDSETRIVGGINVFIDDIDIGNSKIDFTSDTDTNQSVILKLTPGIHLLTVIAAEYQLPYKGAPPEEALLVFDKDEHFFYVKENEDDTIEPKGISNIRLNTEGTPYVEDFSDIFPRYKAPKINYTGLNLENNENPIIFYTYNVSTDNTFHAEKSTFVDFDKVGTGQVVWWTNNNSIANSDQTLFLGTNYIYICAVSVKPNTYLLDNYDCFYPILAFDTIAIKIDVEDLSTITNTLTVTETVTETTYQTSTETITETIIETVTEENAEANFSTLMIPFAISIMIAFSFQVKKRGGKDE